MKTKSKTLPLNQSVATRIVAIMVVATLSLAVLVTGLLIYFSYQHSLQDARQTFVNIEKSYLPSLAAGLWEADPERIDTLLDGIVQLEFVGRVTVIDELGHIQSRHKELESLDNRTYQVKFAIEERQHLVGQLEVELTADTLENQLWKQGAEIGLITVSTLSVSAVLMLLIFRYAFSRHLARMAQYALEIQRSTLDQALVLERPSTRQADELDLVVTAINTMRINLLEDIQAREAAEAELQDHRRNLESMIAARTRELALQNAALDAYAHTVAHDLKHPLTVLLGQARLLQHPGLAPEQQAKLQAQVATSATKMNNIIDALLMLASVRRSDAVQLQPLDVKALARQVSEDLREFAENHQALVRISGHWPKALGFGPWISQVWTNYISNAIKYGGPAASIELGATPLGNKQVKYWVKDQGEGISAEHQQQLFTQFNRLGTTKADGHGLGLSIVQRIVECLGGEVGYETSPEGGSCFWFSLREVENNSAVIPANAGI